MEKDRDKLEKITIHMVVGVNAENQLTGRFDPAISEKELRETRLMADCLQDLGIEFVACSPQRR